MKKTHSADSVKCQDEFYMSYALRLASLGRFTTTPNPNVGCVLVRHGQVVGEGYHLRLGEPHAEIHALQKAGRLAKGSVAYITLEPCCHYGKTPPCVEALIKAGVRRVVVAIEDPNPEIAGRGLYQLKQAGIEVTSGILSAEAQDLNPGFLKRMRTGFPYIQLKMACSLDGRTAMASGESQWITSEQSRQDVQFFRAQSSAILSTGVTVSADNPALTVRWESLPKTTQALYPQESLRQPVRIILDRHHKVTPQHQVVQQPGTCWLIRTKTDHQDWPNQVEQWIFSSIQWPDKKNAIDLASLMTALAKREMNLIWVEAGAELAGGLLEAGLVDELILYMAPKLLGNTARGLCQLTGLNELAKAPEFVLKEARQIGPDLRLRLKPDPGFSISMGK